MPNKYNSLFANCLTIMYKQLHLICMTRKLINPVLFFSMELDNPSGVVIPGLNKGRLSLWDLPESEGDEPDDEDDNYDETGGYIGHWVCYSSFDGKQKVKDWTRTGGVVPPNYAMPSQKWFWIDTKPVVQPGQPVPEGYIVYYKNSNTWKTAEGVTRSEIMLHPDSNYKTSPGSFGCYVMMPDEYQDFKKVYTAACSHLKRVRCGNVYLFQ